MVVKDFKKYNKLSMLLNNSFGSNTFSKSNSEAIILRLIDDELMDARIVMCVNLGTIEQSKMMMPRFKSQALSMLEATLKDLQEKYKENTGKSLSLKIKGDTVQDFVEHLAYQITNPKRTVYYRLTCYVEC